jgi:hypothetical protein
MLYDDRYKGDNIFYLMASYLCFLSTSSPPLLMYLSYCICDIILCDYILLRVHEYTYLAYLEQKVRVAASTNSNGSSNSNSTSVASDVSSSLPPFYAPPGFLDVDTPLSPSSLDAAKRFCGYELLK